MSHHKSHSIIYVPVKGNRRIKLPVILLPDGSRFYEALHWTVSRFNDNFSTATLKKQNDAIGLFIDYFFFCKKNPAVTVHAIRSIIKEFRNIRLEGFTDLGWKPISPNTSDREIEYISLFFDYCTDAFNFASINPVEYRHIDSLSYKERIRHVKQTSSQRNGLLGHLWNKTAAGQWVHASRPIRGRQNLPRGGSFYKTFPPDKVIPLIESCNSIRDVMILILLFYGGIRTSEICHILISDILPFPDPETGAATVILAHPVFGWIDYNRRTDGKQIISGQRQTYLYEEFGMTPRNLISIQDPMHAGWKGITYDENGYRSIVHWSQPDMGVLFYEMHRKYMIIRAKVSARHPYYFINTNPSRSRENFGLPLKIKGIRDRFYDACIRTGLSPSRSNGVNPHGARHFYGFYLANYLKISKEITQRFMHHSSIESTDIYYNISANVARDELIKAFKNASNNPENPLIKQINIRLNNA